MPAPDFHARSLLAQTLDLYLPLGHQPAAIVADDDAGFGACMGKAGRNGQPKDRRAQQPVQEAAQKARSGAC